MLFFSSVGPRSSFFPIVDLLPRSSSDGCNAESISFSIPALTAFSEEIRTFLGLLYPRSPRILGE